MFAFGPVPEGFKAALAMAHDRHRMTNEAYRLQVDEFFSNLSNEQLAILRGLFYSCDENATVAAYYVGLVTAILTYNRKVCVNCGQVHEEDDADAVLKAWNISGEVDLTASLGGKLMAAYTQDPLPFPDDNAEEVWKDDGPLVWGDKLTQQAHANMVQYHIDDAWTEPVEGSDPTFRGFVCLLCGYPYSSIADRMLKEPDDCPGCHLKAGHG